MAVAETDSHMMDKWLEGDAGYDLPGRGEIRQGKIVGMSRGEVLVDIAAKSEGVIVSSELESMSSHERSKLVVGKEVMVYVLNPEDQDGNILLSLARAKEELDWRWAEELLESQEVLEGKVTGFNKGGLLVQMRNVRGFIPASQLDNTRREFAPGLSPDERWASIVGDRVQIKVIEVDRSRNRLILSERAAMREWRESRKDRLLDELQEGEVREGRVINLADFGAFIDLGGADGLVHLSELSWKRVSHPREVLSVGQTVKVYILNVDRDRRRIGLSLKRLEADPWSAVEEAYKIGTLVEATVTKITKFGAFAKLTGLDDIEGLIHISELANDHVAHPRDVLAEGQVVTVRVIRVDSQRRRLGLSVKRVDSDEYLEADWFDSEDWDQADDSPDLDEPDFDQPYESNS
jgi:small subunit ribosomal protein S1